MINMHFSDPRFLRTNLYICYIVIMLLFLDYNGLDRNTEITELQSVSQ